MTDEAKRLDPAKTDISDLVELVMMNGPEVEITRIDEGGHSGVGWYVWSTEYPEHGSVFLTSSGDVLVEVMKAIVTRAVDAEVQVEELQRELHKKD